ncbi:respiratory chain complex I subunit 1 family protein [Acidiphilium sp.]|uniref:respiratory chain complex I subunit 1 family protein n=1 Tax=Acidiphilium sp. TaxID=527 RepID=UPI003D08C3B1
MGLITPLLLQFFQMALMLALAPLLAGGVRVLKARLQRRAGPPVLQIYRDLAKLIGKDSIVATDASWIFRAAPYLIFATTWVSASLVPSFGTNLLFSWSGDLIVIVALLGTARFFQMLAALDIGTAFGGLGASREAMFASLAEPAMLMIVFTVALVAGSSQLSVIATFMHGGTQGLRLSLAMGLVALVIVSLAETGRFPVDNPATHLELTMVHEAMVLEYSGRHLALIELAHALKLTLYLSLIACIFAPIAIAGPGALPWALLLGLLAYLAKLTIGSVLLAIFETAIAKMRVFRVPNFLGAALMLGLLGTLLLFVSASL